MNRFRILLALPLVLLAASTAAPPTTRPSEARKPAYDDYRLITDRNIFSKDRSRPSRSERYERPSQSTSRPAYTSQPVRGSDMGLVLAGVAVHQGAEMAFFEDRRTGETFRVPTGQSVGSGKVVSICLDSIEYGCESTTRTVRVGENLAGAAAGPAVAAGSATAQPAWAGDSATTQPAGASGDTPADKAANDILERMRLRRLQELKK